MSQSTDPDSESSRGRTGEHGETETVRGESLADSDRPSVVGSDGDGDVLASLAPSEQNESPKGIISDTYIPFFFFFLWYSPQPRLKNIE